MNASQPLIRTFRARDARSALSAVKAAFGADAVIIETKELQGGLFSKPQIEVTAASGERPAPKSERTTDRVPENDMVALRRVMEDVRRSLHHNNHRDGVGGDRTPGHELSADARRVL